LIRKVIYLHYIVSFFATLAATTTSPPVVVYGNPGLSGLALPATSSGQARHRVRREKQGVKS